MWDLNVTYRLWEDNGKVENVSVTFWVKKIERACAT